jgi:hypothetical protein
LSLLLVGRQVDLDVFAPTYERYLGRYSALVVAPLVIDSGDVHNSYFKFNLDYVTLYDLVRLEPEGSSARDEYLRAYAVVRSATRTHGNAFFNMIDRGLSGVDTGRDAETRKLLDQWLERSRRDEYVDLRCCYDACGADRACEPIDVVDRVRTDFVWQRSPFLLYGGGDGTIETAGIDYILPYWMARYYGLFP